VHGILAIAFTEAIVFYALFLLVTNILRRPGELPARMSFTL